VRAVPGSIAWASAVAATGERPPGERSGAPASAEAPESLDGKAAQGEGAGRSGTGTARS
jgi:hypothetical protein